MDTENKQQTGRLEILVNGNPKYWKDETISYSQAVDLAFPPPRKGSEMFTVQYSRGPRDNPQGTLVNGQDVKVVDGVVFDVTRTDKS